MERRVELHQQGDDDAGDGPANRAEAVDAFREHAQRIHTHHAAAQGEPFHWGEVWEWTGTTFGGYPGFTADPYRDYSEPWFGTHKVLRGASFATRARMHNAKYRNFYLPHRDDIFAGFRSCAL